MFYFNIYKKLGIFELNADFSLQDNEILCILGQSGCGKSTILNLISGILAPDNGFIKSDNTIYFSYKDKINLPIYKRKFGYIEQKSNLFPHLTALENIYYGISNKKDDIYTKEKLEKLINIFSLRGHLEKMPHELSGGQCQRVSIIRAIMTNPDLLLLDEPFSALDNVLRVTLRNEIINLKKSFNIPMIFVTHDLEEGYFIGDKIMIIDNGKVISNGLKDEVFQKPNNLQTALFVGITNIVDGQIISENNSEYIVKIGNIALVATKRSDYKNKIKIGVNPSNIIFTKKDITNSNVMSAKVINMKKFADKYKLNLQIDNISKTFVANMPHYIINKNTIKTGDIINIYIDKDDIIALED